MEDKNPVTNDYIHERIELMKHTYCEDHMRIIQDFNRQMQS